MEAAAIELEHAIGFTGSAYGCLHYHPNGQDIVYVAGGCVVIADINDAHNQVFLRGHDNNITCLALSSSGRFIASGQIGENADVIIWDFASKQLIYRLQEHDYGISCVSFSDDERFLSTIGIDSDQKMVIWDLSNGYIVATNTKMDPTECMAWGGRQKDVKRRATDNYQLATAGKGHLKYWVLNPIAGELIMDRCNTGTQVRRYTCLGFTKNGEYLYGGSESGDFVSVHVRNKVLHCTIPACTGGVQAMLVSGDEEIIVGGGDGSITFFQGDGRNFRVTQMVKVNGKVSAVAVIPDSNDMIVGTLLGFIYKLNMNDPKEMTVLSENHCDSITAVAYPPDVSDRFATCGVDGSIRVWDVSDYRVEAKGICREGGTPTCISFTGECVFTGWTDGRIRAHDAETGENLWCIDNVHRSGVTALLVSHNHKFLVSGGQEGEVRVWEIRTRELISHLKEHSMRVTDLVLFDDDMFALSSSRDRSFLCWDLRRERRISNHTQRMGGINSIALHNDQTRVLTVGQEKKITYWDMREPSPLQILSTSHEQTTITISHNGRLFATAGTDQVVKLWHFEQGAQIAEGQGHSGTVNSLAFSPDDKQLVSVGSDGNIFVWNIYVD